MKIVHNLILLFNSHFATTLITVDPYIFVHNLTTWAGCIYISLVWKPTK